jgi:hypothetical protein
MIGQQLTRPQNFTTGLISRRRKSTCRQGSQAAAKDRIPPARRFNAKPAKPQLQNGSGLTPRAVVHGLRHVAFAQVGQVTPLQTRPHGASRLETGAGIPSAATMKIDRPEEETSLGPHKNAAREPCPLRTDAPYQAEAWNAGCAVIPGRVVTPWITALRPSRLRLMSPAPASGHWRRRRGPPRQHARPSAGSHARCRGKILR